MLQIELRQLKPEVSIYYKKRSNKNNAMLTKKMLFQPFVEGSNRLASLGVRRENVPRVHCTRRKIIEKEMCIETTTNHNLSDSRTSKAREGSAS